MTLDELVFHQRGMADRGCSAAEIAAFGESARKWLVERRLYRAVKVALQSPPLESGFQAAKADSVAAPEPFRTSPEKSAARAGLLASGLRPGAIAVGGRLLEHLNLDTGRCDPGIARMARDLGLSERSVRRSIGELEAAGLVIRLENTGRGHTNVYRLDLAAMGAIASAAAPQRRTRESANPDARVLQNRRRKQLPSVDVERPARAGQRPPDPQQPQMLLPIVNRGAVAAASAERRVMDDIEREGRRRPSFNVSGLTPAQWADVHAAERHQRGEGIALIHRMLAATGPPAAANGG